MRYSIHQIQKFLKQKGNEFEYEGVKFRVLDTKHKELYDYELERNIKYFQPELVKDKFKMLKVANPYIYAFYSKKHKKYFNSNKMGIEDIKNEYISNFSNTINGFKNDIINCLIHNINFYNDIINSYEIHKINFITDSVEEIINDPLLKNIRKIFFNFNSRYNKQTKMISYIRDHFCRNIGKEYYMIHFNVSGKSNILDLYYDLLENNVTKDKIHKNKYGVFLKTEKYDDENEAELFYVKLQNENMKKIDVYHCSNLEIKHL